MTTSLATPPKLQFFDLNGAPLSGGKLYTYVAGTTTPQVTYTDYVGGTPNANPVILDSRGEASVWLGTALYKMALYSATNVLIWTVDNIGGFATLAQLAASGGSNLIGFLQAGTGAVATTVQAKLRESVSVLDFGAVGDGVTDDSLAFSTARTYANTLGKKVYAPAGTYKLNTALTSTENLILEGDGPSSILDFTGTVTGGNYGLEAIGAATLIQDLSISPSIGATSLTFASAPSLSTGDVFVIYNPTDYSWSGFRTNYRAGEWCEVESVSGSVVKLKNQLYDTYVAASVDVYKISGPKVVLRNFKVIGTTITGLMNTTLCVSPLIENVTGENENNSVINFDRCFKPTVNNPQVKNVGDGGDDYGIAIGNSQHARINGGSSYARRHAVTTGGNSEICCVPCRDVITEGTLLKNDIASGTAAADFHGNTEASFYKNCTIFGGGHLQGKNNLFVGCKIYNALQGWVLYTSEVKGGFLGAVDCDYITYINPQPFTRGIYDIGGNSDGVTASTVEDVTFISENCRLKGANLSALTSFMLFKNRGATVKTNFKIDGLTATVNLHGTILTTATVSGTPSADFIVVDNVLNFPSGSYLHNSTGGAYDSFPHRLQRQSGKYSSTTTVTSSIIAPAQTYRYSYNRQPDSFISIKGTGGATLGSLGGQKPIVWSYDTDGTAIRPIVETTANMTAGVNFDLCWSVELREC